MTEPAPALYHSTGFFELLSTMVENSETPRNDDPIVFQRLCDDPDPISGSEGALCG